MVSSIHQSRKDVETSLTSASQLQQELDKSLSNMIAVIGLFRNDLPDDCHSAMSQVVDEDLIPSLEHLGNTLLQLQTRMDRLGLQIDELTQGRAEHDVQT